VAYFHAGRVESSIAASLKILSLNDRFAPAHYNLALAYQTTGEGERAKAHYEKAKALGYAISPEMELEWNRGE
jgi:tetratricopeptide (TPR) repeat protein